MSEMTTRRSGWPNALSLWRVVIALACVVGATWVGAGTASAHVELVSSRPGHGSTLHSAPAQVQLRFSAPVRTDLTKVKVTDPAGVQVSVGSTRVSGATVSKALGDITRAGRYVINYRAVSPDGHPVAGEVEFLLGQAAVQADRSRDSTQSNNAQRPSGTSRNNRAGGTHDNAATAGFGDMLPLAFGALLGVVVLGAAIFVVFGRRAN